MLIQWDDDFCGKFLERALLSSRGREAMKSFLRGFFRDEVAMDYRRGYESRDGRCPGSITLMVRQEDGDWEVVDEARTADYGDERDGPP